MNKRAHPRICTFNFYLSILLAVAVSSNAFSQNTTPDYAGSIVYSVGDVVAVDAEGVTRPLGRRTDIYIGDTLYTGADSSAQLSMSDSAQIILHESTVFEIKDYTFESGANDSIVLDLIEGGFRTVTGSVSKEQYRANVRGFSSIGIRGTEYEAWKAGANRLLVAIYDGGITISNLGGELDLGIDADFDYAEVQNIFLPPVGLEDMPVGLDELQFAVAVQPADQLLDAGQATDNIAGTVGTLDPNDNLVAAVDTSLTQTDTDIEPAVTGDFLDYVASLVASDDDESALNSIIGVTDQATPDSSGRSSSTTRNRRLSRSQAISAADRVVDAATDAVDDTADAVADVADTVEAVVGDVVDATGIEPTELVNDSLAAAEELAPLPLPSLTATLPIELPQQESALLADISNTAAAVFTTPNVNAVFDTIESIESIASSQVAPVVDQVEQTIVTVESAVEPVVETVVAAVDGTPVGDIVDTAGTAAIEVGDGVAATANGLVEDLPSGAAGDLVETVAGDETVESVVGVGETVLEEATSTVATVVEDGPADAVAAVVENEVEEVVATVIETVEEVVEEVVETVPTGEIVETFLALSSPLLDAPSEEVAAVVEILPVETAEEPEPEAEEETVVAAVLGDAPTTGSMLALKKAPAVMAKVSTDNTNWGAWNAPVPEHIANGMTISAGDYSVDLTPAPMDNLTGSYKYSAVTDYQGHGSAGNLTGLEAGFDVDFNTGVISNGILSVAVEDTQNWLLGFDGLIEQGVVDLNSLGGSLIELSPRLDSVSPIDGDLSGAFTGQQAESFIGGFELLDLQNPLNTVEGIYTIER